MCSSCAEVLPSAADAGSLVLSRGGIYALQATLHLAGQSTGEPISAARIADALELQPDYLAKVLSVTRS